MNRVGRRIAEVAGRRDYDWEFTVIDDDKTVNAFALPGGKVAVYTMKPASGNLENIFQRP
ncbi:MAG: M48 family metalloprotease [Thermodesulfobacteriota bacterium]|nr:M48 family metalloprotease [Thermodesulfobacteriota bacterium]